MPLPAHAPDRSALASGKPPGPPPAAPFGGARAAGPPGRTAAAPPGARCARCDRPLTGREPTIDYCGPTCQDAWYRERADPYVRETPIGREHHILATPLWERQPCPSAAGPRPC
jgi:hypothetical protein